MLVMLLFCSFQCISAALILETCFCTTRFPTQSLQRRELEAAYLKSPMRARQLQHLSLKQPELHRRSLQSLNKQLFSKELSSNTLGSFNQLDLEHSLSFTEFASTKFSYKLQTESFHRISFELRALHCAALQDIASTTAYSFRTDQLKPFSFQSSSLPDALFQGELCKQEL